MPRILIIGFGNTLRGDDGAGVVAADRLRGLSADPRLTILETHQLLPELATDVAAADLVIFIDACCDQPPGAVACRTVEAADQPAVTLGHHVHPGTLLTLARLLHQAAPVAMAFTVGVAAMELGEGLSPPVATGVDQIVARVGDVVRDFLGGRRGPP